MPSRALPSNRLPHDLIGAHLSTRGGLHTIFERAQTVGAGALALFSRNGNQWRAKNLNEEEISLFRRLHRESGNPPLLIHTSYLINLATTNPEFETKSLAGMQMELERAEALGVPAVVLHPGAHLGEGIEKGIDRIARAFDRVHAAIPQSPVLTLLETSAGQGSCLGCTFEELGRIIDRVDQPRRLGICIDTCHVFAAGYDIRTREGYERMMDEMEEHVGLDRLLAIHLNDSKKPLGSRVDRHEHIGDGEIGLGAFERILNDPRLENVPKVIETPKPTPFEADIRNLETLRSLVKSRRRRVKASFAA